MREICDFEDDPNVRASALPFYPPPHIANPRAPFRPQTPILTWRFFFLSGIFTALGAWLSQMGFFRTTYVPVSLPLASTGLKDLTDLPSSSSTRSTSSKVSSIPILLASTTF